MVINIVLWALSALFLALGVFGTITVGLIPAVFYFLIGLALNPLLNKLVLKIIIALACAAMIVVSVVPGVEIPLNMMPAGYVEPLIAGELPPNNSGSTSNNSSAANSSDATNSSVDPTKPVVDVNHTVFWATDATLYHLSNNCETLLKSKNAHEGTLQQAVNAGRADPCDLCVIVA